MFRSFSLSCAAVLCLTASLAVISVTAGAKAEPRQQFQPAETSGHKILTRQHRFSNEPIQVVDVEVKGQRIRLGAKAASFNEANDWLKGLVVRFKNVSDKPISSVEFHLSLADPETSANIITFTLKYGQTPSLGAPDMAEPLKPGETAELALSESWYDQANLSLRRSHNTPLTVVETADLQLSYVYFNDDTAWYSGSLLRRDPTDASRYSIIE
jgi:hypothetical protein